MPTASAQPRQHHLAGSPTGAPGGWRPALLVRQQRPVGTSRDRPVLYIHGATFPSASSVMFRFDGISWADRLNRAGFVVFALDFAGYGGSERYPDMAAASPPEGGPLGRGRDAADQIARAVRFILAETAASRISLVAHSWGTMPAGLFAGRHPDLVDRMVLFGPIVRREGGPGGADLRPWRPLTVAEQHARFVEDVPEGQAPVLLENEFPRWAETYLDSEPRSRDRAPPFVKTPTGPLADIIAAWSGALSYDPALVRCPVAIVRGAWDSLCTDADAAWLRTALIASPLVRDITVPRATHLMHLERGREALYEATNSFLEEFP